MCCFVEIFLPNQMLFVGGDLFVFVLLVLVMYVVFGGLIDYHVDQVHLYLVVVK